MSSASSISSGGGGGGASNVTVDYIKGYVDAGNSSTTPLAANGVFTGTAIDVTNFAVINVNVYSDVASATNGVTVQFSPDGTNWDHSHSTTYSSANGVGYIFNVEYKYARVVYTNDGSAQSVFRLQTILKPTRVQSSLLRLNQNPTDYYFAELTKSVIQGKTTAGGSSYVDVKVTPSGSLTVALGDITGVVGQNTMANSLPVTIASNQSAVPVSDNGGSITVDGTVAATQSGAWTVTANAGTGTFVVGDGGGSLTVDGSVSATQSGSWSVTANAGTNLNTSLLALESGGNLATIKTNTDNLSLSIGSTTSGQKGNLILGAVTTSAPSYTTLQSNPLSLTTSGLLRVDGSGVTQPISGTVTANAGTGTFAISAASLPLPTGAATETTLSTLNGKIPSNLTVTATRLLVDGSGVTQPVSGTIAATQSGAWSVTANAGTNLNTSALALESGGNLASIKTNTDNLSLSIGSTTSGQKGNLILGATTTAAPTYTTGQSNPLSLTTAGAVRVDGSATTQPVSGTVTANAGTGTFAISAASLPLPTGAATETTLSTLNGKIPANLTVTSTRLLVDGSGVTQPVSGTVAATQSGTWTVTPTVPKAGTSTLTNVSGSITSVQLLAANTARVGGMIYNDSTAVLYLKLGTTASTTSFTVKLNQDDYYEFSGPAVYTGIVHGIWDSAAGAARVTELT